MDILGNRELVFKAALSGGKNAAARRDIPVHADDAGMFREVLAGLGLAKDATPVQRDRLPAKEEDDATHPDQSLHRG